MSKETLPTSNFAYTPGYDNRKRRETNEAPRPWDMTSEILSRWTAPQGTLVDVGCGPARKLFTLQKIPHIIGVDKTLAIINNAAKNTHEAGISNIKFVLGDANNIPMPAGSVDMVSYMLSPFNGEEAFRVLKPGGLVILERVGERDKANIKAFFTDLEGRSRGYRSDLPPGAVGDAFETELHAAGFKEIIRRDGFWDTWYSRAALKIVLRETPTIHGYNESDDKRTVNRMIKKLKTPKGIYTQQHRVLLIAKK